MQLSVKEGVPTTGENMTGPRPSGRLSRSRPGPWAARWVMRWKTALNAFDIASDGRLPAARQ